MKKLVDKRNDHNNVIVCIGTLEECKLFRDKNYKIIDIPLISIMDVKEGDVTSPIPEAEKVNARSVDTELKKDVILTPEKNEADEIPKVVAVVDENTPKVKELPRKTLEGLESEAVEELENEKIGLIKQKVLILINGDTRKGVNVSVQIGGKDKAINFTPKEFAIILETWIFIVESLFAE